MLCHPYWRSLHLPSLKRSPWKMQMVKQSRALYCRPLGGPKPAESHSKVQKICKMSSIARWQGIILKMIPCDWQVMTRLTKARLVATSKSCSVTMAVGASVRCPLPRIVTSRPAAGECNNEGDRAEMKAQLCTFSQSFL